MTEDQVKVQRCSLLLASLDKSRKDGFLCDFTVRVGRKSFPAHRLVLANSSPYFKILFQTEMKEVQDGLIDMKDVDSDAIELCISFMYTGEVNIAMEAVQHVLHASNLLQLDDLKNLCVRKMQKNLTPRNCLFILELARLYDRFELIKSAVKFLTSNFDAVVSSDMFTSIGKAELLRYMEISNASYRTMWTAAVKWSKGQIDTLAKFTELISKMDFQNFPIKFLLEIVLEEPLVQKSEKTENNVIKMIFNDVGKLREHIEVDNCFVLKKQAETHEIPNNSEVQEVIFGFLEENFEEIVKKSEFCEINKLDVTKLLSSTNIRCSDEIVKYEAVLKWIKHDIKNRKKAFSELFFLIRLETLPEKFLREIVRKESLVTESRKCNDRLMDEFCSRLEKATSSATTQQAVPALQASSSSETVRKEPLVTESHKYSDWRLNDSRSTREKPSSSAATLKADPDSKASSSVEKDFSVAPVCTNKQPKGHMSSILDFFETHYEIIYTFQGDTLQGVRYDFAEFTAYLPNTPEGPKLELMLGKAFDAGLTFELEDTGNGQGKIVWGDIPHKTCLTGGPPNGYPDPDYFNRLRQVLKEKGIESDD